MYKAQFTISDDALRLYNCLIKESHVRDRSTITVKKGTGSVKVLIESLDAVAFRSSVNSITQFLAVFDQMKGVK